MSAPRIDGEYLFLDVAAGADAFITLHDRLYGGALLPYRSRTQTYQPHITIGRSASPARLRDAAIEVSLVSPQAISMLIDQVAIFRVDEAMRGEVQELVDLVPRAEYV